MTIRFTKDDDPTEILQFSFQDQNGNITKSSIKSALKPPYPPKYYINACLTVVGKYIQSDEKLANILKFYYILGLVVFLLWNYGIIPGNKLGFFCNDPLFSHPYRGDTVSATVLGFGIGLLFPIIYFIIESVRQETFKEIFTLPNLFGFYVYFKQFLIGLIIVGGVTEIGKLIRRRLKYERDEVIREMRKWLTMMVGLFTNQYKYQPLPLN